MLLFPTGWRWSSSLCTCIVSIQANLHRNSYVSERLFMTAGLYNAAAQTFGLEKESKIREALRMQGVSSCALTSSWCVALGLLYFLTVLLMAVASKLCLFEKAAFGLLLLGYWASLTALMALAWCLHTLFHKAKTGGLVTVVVFVGAYPLWKSVQGADISTAARLLAQLHPGTACCFIIQTLALFEGSANGVTGKSVFTPLNGPTFGEALLMLIVDCGVLLGLGMYLELVLPKEFGTRLPLCFCCHRDENSRGGPRNPIVPLAVMDACEEPSSAEQEQERLEKCIAIRGLCKNFGDLSAVKDLSLTMFEGQIFALLGKNGAGKTTTINLITGLYEPTAGDANVYGHRITTDMAEIRRDIGTCFQADVLYPSLTVSLSMLFSRRADLRNGPVLAQVYLAYAAAMPERPHNRPDDALPRGS